MRAEPLLDRTYDVTNDDAEWLRTIAEALTPLLDCGQGVFAWFYDATALDRIAFRDVLRLGVSDEVARAIFVTNEDPRTTVALREKHYQTAAGPFSAGLGVDFDGHHAFHEHLGAAGIGDLLVINALDPSRLGVAIGAPSRRRLELPEPKIALLERVSAHVATAHRLRRRLRASVELAPEAIFDARGDLVHAEGAAKDAEARECLARAIAAAERARGRLRTLEIEEALQARTALVEGRWSLVEAFERGGKRYVLAYVNPVPTTAVRKLTPRESEVLHLAALGHANKLIAYELGIAVSTVGNLLSRAFEKLGVASRVDAVKVFAALRRSTPM